jgi:hypothetical protein
MSAHTGNLHICAFHEEGGHLTDDLTDDLTNTSILKEREVLTSCLLKLLLPTYGYVF